MSSIVDTGQQLARRLLKPRRMTRGAKGIELFEGLPISLTLFKGSRIVVGAAIEDRECSLLRCNSTLNK